MSFREPGILVVLGLLATACSPPRVAKVGSSHDADTSADTTSPEWEDESTAATTAGDEHGDGHDEAGDEGPRYDIQNHKFDVPIDHGCADPLPSTLVEGQTELGPFTGVHAYFGHAWGEIKLVVYDDSVDLDHELGHADWYGGDIDEGPALVGMIQVDYEQLPVQATVAVEHVTPDEQLWVMADITIDSAQFEDGDPYVPRVLTGTIAPWPSDAPDGYSGSFAATRCKVFEAQFPIE